MTHFSDAFAAVFSQNTNNESDGWKKPEAPQSHCDHPLRKRQKLDHWEGVDLSNTPEDLESRIIQWPMTRPLDPKRRHNFRRWHVYRFQFTSASCARANERAEIGPGFAYPAHPTKNLPAIPTV